DARRDQGRRLRADAGSLCGRAARGGRRGTHRGEDRAPDGGVVRSVRGVGAAGSRCGREAGEGAVSEWELQTLDHIVDLRRGFDLPSRNRQGGSVPVLSAGSTAGWHDTPAVAGPGMVVGRATNLGVPTWSEKDFWPLNTTLYAADFYGNEPRWVFHLFETLDLAGYDSGSVQPMLNRNYIAKIRVKVPPLPRQQAIAEVLGALDDKIGANRKLAATADALARSIFAEAARDASLSEETYGDLAKIGGGGTPKSKVEEFWTGDVRWLTPTDVTALPG